MQSIVCIMHWLAKCIFLACFILNDCLGGIRVKYARRYVQETNVVMLDPDVVCIVPNAVAANSSCMRSPAPSGDKIYRDKAVRTLRPRRNSMPLPDVRSNRSTSDSRITLRIQLVSLDQSNSTAPVLALHNGGVVTGISVSRMADSASLGGGIPVASIAACCVSFQLSLDAIRFPSPSCTSRVGSLTFR